MVDGRALTAQFEDAADFETRKVLCGGQLLTVLFLDGLTSGRDIAEQVVRPLAQMTDEAREEVLYTRALQGGVWCASVKEPESTQQAAASADAGAAAGGNGHRKKDADQGHGLLDRSPDGPGAAAQDAGETFFHRH